MEGVREEVREGEMEGGRIRGKGGRERGSSADG